MSRAYDEAAEAMRRASLRLDAALRAFKQGEEDEKLEEILGGVSQEERAAIEADKAEVARMEAEARSRPGPSEKRKNLMWSWNKRRR